MKKEHAHRHNPIEVAANNFALGLLMPDELFIALVKSGVTDIADIAEHFGVPVRAAILKAQKLGYRLE